MLIRNGLLLRRVQEERNLSLAPMAPEPWELRMANSE